MLCITVTFHLDIQDGEKIHVQLLVVEGGTKIKYVFSRNFMSAMRSCSATDRQIRSV